MIHAIRCDQPSFRSISFTKGFNVVLAERTQDSTKKGSRNGLGKSTLIEIIHFCLGSSAQNNPLFQEPLKDWTFFLDIELGGQDYTVKRNTASPGRVIIEGNCSDWPIKPHVSTETGEMYMPVHDWNSTLGWIVFGLKTTVRDKKYSPTFRSLFSYFCRRGQDAYRSPFQQHSQQIEWDKQVNNLFLLGLDWEYAQKWQDLRDQERTLDQLKKAMETGLVSRYMGTIGALEATKVRLEEQVENMRKQLATFKVHPQYREVEDRANKLTAEIHQLSNDNVTDARMVQFYQSSFKGEQPASHDQVAKVYAELGQVLPERIVKRLEEVQEFHRRIVANRESFLKSEIDRLASGVERRAERVSMATDERATLMAILQTHGALEEYTKMQELLLHTAQQLEEAKAQIANLKKFEEGKSAVRMGREQLFLEARSDHDERKPIWERAVSLFNANSETLYETPGKLIIDVRPTGYRFDVEIERSNSQGIGQMKVFCYDLMLAQLWSLRHGGPDVLIHDSSIFDGVDERQIANALQLIAKETDEYDFQYICCLNSDLVPWNDFEEGFNLRQYVRVELTDTRADGGLLGIRF